MIVARIRGKIIRTDRCCICVQQLCTVMRIHIFSFIKMHNGRLTTYEYEQFLKLTVGLVLG